MLDLAAVFFSESHIHATVASERILLILKIR
jgi:hypothetical protein